jgi:hypothetical protein
MENTYTYSARSIENPNQVVTFTLQDHRMSVGSAAPLEKIENVLQQAGAGEDAEQRSPARLWLRPLAVSLLERGMGPFRVGDVNAAAGNDWLRVNAWYRVGGLVLAPVTLVDGRVDNPPAAQAFVEELDRRKSEIARPFGALDLLDYWLTWILAGGLMLGLFQAWRRRSDS